MAGHIQSLEARRLLALATWDGGGDNATWTDPANWAGDSLPADGDDLNITTSGPAIRVPANVLANAILLENREIAFTGPATVNSTFVIKSGGHVRQRDGAGNLMLSGTGSVLIESGGQLTTDAYPPTPVSYRINSKLPITNHGSILVNAGSNFQAGIINYGELRLQGSSGGVYGEIVNETTGTIKSFRYSYSPNSAYGGTVEIGLKRFDDGVVTPASITNRGKIYSTRSGELTNGGMSLEWPPYFGNGLKVFIDGSPSLGGEWNAGDCPLHFLSTNGTHLVLDSTFSMGFGTMIIDQGITTASVQGLSPTAGLVVGAGCSVTMTGVRNSWGLLRIGDGAAVTLASGSRSLHIQDIEVVGSGRLDIGDGLLIHGNQPGYLRSWVTSTTPATTPAYAGSLGGNINGTPLTIEPNGSRHAVGYTTGAGLASHYPTHSFRGETFDDNDFVFFTTLRGDANFDRQVNFDDLLVVAQRYGQSTSRGFADGNFAGNVTTSGMVDFDDLLLLAQSYETPFAKRADGVVPGVARGQKGRAVVRQIDVVN